MKRNLSLNESMKKNLMCGFDLGDLVPRKRYTKINTNQSFITKKALVSLDLQSTMEKYSTSQTIKYMPPIIKLL
jgi:hypothetical protein